MDALAKILRKTMIELFLIYNKKQILQKVKTKKAQNISMKLFRPEGKILIQSSQQIFNIYDMANCQIIFEPVVVHGRLKAQSPGCPRLSKV